ncbi:NTF2 fold immunity protein [Prevotellaceae bacterium HUN156]|nr:NTF2 fold immunity protein [Prevotellaceae bacterium HUN156]
MKKTYYFILLLMIQLIGCTSNNSQPTPMYKYYGTFENDSDMKSLRMDHIFREDYTKEQRKQLEQGEFEKGLEEPAVPDAETAFYIARRIMINKFGEEDVKKDYPFKVWLVDKYEWRIIGSSKGRQRWGDSSITCSICRLDGRVLGCYHEKQ